MAVEPINGGRAVFIDKDGTLIDFNAMWSGWADEIGRRRIYLIGAGVFAATSLLAGVAANDVWLIAARALMGIGEIGWGSPLHVDGFITDQELADLVSNHAVGEMLGWAFDQNGEVVSINIPGLRPDEQPAVAATGDAEPLGRDRPRDLVECGHASETRPGSRPRRSGRWDAHQRDLARRAQVEVDGLEQVAERRRVLGGDRVQQRHRVQRRDGPCAVGRRGDRHPVRAGNARRARRPSARAEDGRVGA